MLDEIKRRAGILDEAGAGINRVLQHIHSGIPFIMMSATRPNYSNRENRARNQKLRKMLKNYGFGSIPVTGWWEDTREEAVFSPIRSRDIKDQDYVKRIATRLGREFDQDAVIVGNGEDVLILDKNGDIITSFDATTIRQGDLAILPGKSEIKGRQVGLIKKTDSRFQPGVGKQVIGKKAPSSRKGSFDFRNTG